MARAIEDNVALQALDMTHNCLIKEQEKYIFGVCQQKGIRVEL